MTRLVAEANRCQATITSRTHGTFGQRCAFAWIREEDGRRVCGKHSAERVKAPARVPQARNRTSEVGRNRSGDGRAVNAEGKPQPLRLPLQAGHAFPLSARGVSRAVATWEPRREAVSIDLVVDDRNFHLELPLRAFLAAQQGASA